MKQDQSGSIKVLEAEKPYRPDCGDLVCCEGSAEYLETPPRKFPVDKQVMPLAVISPNPWYVLEELGINPAGLKIPYECPYTGYSHYGVVPVALISDDLKKYKIHGSTDYWFDYEYHEQMWGDKRFELTDIQKLLLGSGYTYGTRINDGSRSDCQTIVNLSNGDCLWVHFWIWYNK